MGKYICQRPIHPGELLKEETEERKLSQRKLAEQMGISYKVLNDILNCRRPVTTQTAMLFEAALGISASLLMRMQLDCNMQQAASDPTFMERLKQVRKPGGTICFIPLGTTYRPSSSRTYLAFSGGLPPNGESIYRCGISTESSCLPFRYFEKKSTMRQ